MLLSVNYRKFISNVFALWLCAIFHVFSSLWCVSQFRRIHLKFSGGIIHSTFIQFFFLLSSTQKTTLRSLDFYCFYCIRIFFFFCICLFEYFPSAHAETMRLRLRFRKYVLLYLVRKSYVVVVAPRHVLLAFTFALHSGKLSVLKQQELCSSIFSDCLIRKNRVR